MAITMNLTNEQQSVIDHDSGLLRVIACPGSGKTEVVSRRIASLIEKGAEPGSIVAITFTEKAAEELKTRIRERLDAEAPERADFGDMYIGTIHSFAIYLLKELEPEYRSFDILDDARRVAFVSKGTTFYNGIHLNGMMNDLHMTYYGMVLRFIESSELMLIENIDPDRVTNQRFVKHFREYLALLRKEKYFDFQTVLYTLVEELENSPEKISLIAEKLKHITVDEYQDVDPLQERLLKILSEVSESLCVVGDDDQGIYHWRGTDVSILRDFDKRYSSRGRVTDIKLQTDFRSTSGVVRLSRKFIEGNDERLPKEMTHNPDLEREHEQSDIQYNFFETDAEELDYIVSRIWELEGSDYTDKRNNRCSLGLGDMAILVRTNDDASRVINYLDSMGIDSVAYSGETIFDRSEVKFALQCLAYLFGQKVYVSRNINEKPALKVPLEDDLLSGYDGVFDRAEFPSVNGDRFLKGMRMIKEDIDEIMAKGKRDYLGDLGLQAIYHRILSAMGAEVFDFGDVINYNLSALSRAISDYESVWQRLRASQVKWFFNFMWAYGKSHYSDQQHQDPAMINAVRVMTIHKAKGLEFPAVFVPAFIKRRKRPLREIFVDRELIDNYEKYDEDDDDNRRLYYTAFTRSEKYLFITGSKDWEGKVNSKSPHPFVDELDSSLLSPPQSIAAEKSGLEPRLRTEGTFSTSYSNLNTYRRCPNDYLLRNVYGYNAGVPPGFGYGTNIHNILNIIHKDYIRNGHVPTEKEIDGMFDRVFKLRYAPGDMKKGMEKSARSVVKKYVEMYRADFERILETEKRFEFVMDKALISGQIDLMKKMDPDGNITRVEIIDFKSEKDNGVYNADYVRQLRYYAIACLESLGKKPEKALVHHLDDGAQPTEVDISEPYLAETKKEISETVDSIIGKQFEAKPKSKTCLECDYKLLCSKKGFQAS